MPRLLYTLFFVLLLPVILLRLLYRAWRAPAYARRWRERFAFDGDLRTDGIWVHAVSVGESIAAAPMIRELQRRHPNLPVTVTCMTPTGSEQIRKMFGDSVGHAYLPYDLPWLQRRFIRRLAPRVCIIMETELWPNLVAECRRAAVPVVLANGRLSERSARGYRRVRALVGPMFASLDWAAVQSRPEADRFIDLGVQPARLTVTGSIKFDITPDPSRQAEAQAWRDSWGERPVWVAASTHAGEDQLVLEAHQAVLQAFPESLLILVPRHPERFDAVARQIGENGMKMIRRTAGGSPQFTDRVMLGDTMGEMMLFFGCADVAFVGGSLVPTGGHNYLEPAALGLPVLSGPHRFNFAEVSTLLEEAGSMRIVEDASELADQVIGYFQQPATATRAGAAGRSVVLANQGALERLLQGTGQLLGSGEPGQAAVR
ncbi:3-deoxy-D-manno-octulosonic-acid transferase [Halopseudomonas xinjiangensis]|uniref:3-deoxy-D-manno-octulosonic acid transferase n=1 Tax=Halopseudomonas xinjiangensis TaxID=487184 RepID=A0A1H1M2I4_9GAMM|nr:lipid IV(A) 3-deoxy-D-manno-octulosonic acid transferase [Halopseudomonas xinjiangensis]SDR80712.1 3-deoxy-D-manno-octulosonic-acid transferase [Halopseudomonas xinjiangensis]